MGTAQSGESELIRVTLVDYFSSTILVDPLVCPDVQMNHYNTRFSGVTKRDMERARLRGACIMGRDQARAMVWRFVGPNTVVVGHSAHNDLTALRWIHPRVIDTFLLESLNAKAARGKETALPPSVLTSSKGQRKESGALSLKSLAMLRLNREIQASRKGHDSLEDALATRDLAHWNITIGNMYQA
jgi:RNA exonuclease 1